MSEKRRAILADLDAAGISYELVDHPAVKLIRDHGSSFGWVDLS